MWGDALLLSFRGIVNWLGCFDVVVMRERGLVGKRLAKAPLQLKPILFLAYEGSVLASGEKE